MLCNTQNSPMCFGELISSVRFNVVTLMILQIGLMEGESVS